MHACEVRSRRLVAGLTGPSSVQPPKDHGDLHRSVAGSWVAMLLLCRRPLQVEIRLDATPGAYGRFQLASPPLVREPEAYHHEQGGQVSCRQDRIGADKIGPRDQAASSEWSEYFAAVITHSLQGHRAGDTPRTSQGWDTGRLAQSGLRSRFSKRDYLG